MDKDRIYYSELKCYAEATEKQRKVNYTSPFYDMLGIESEGLKKELRAFVLHHGGEKYPFQQFFVKRLNSGGLWIF